MAGMWASFTTWLSGKLGSTEESLNLSESFREVRQTAAEAPLEVTGKKTAPKGGSLCVIKIRLMIARTASRLLLRLPKARR